MSEIKSYPATDTVKESQRVLGYDPSGALTISITIKDLREYIEVNSSLPAAQVTFDPDGTSIIATDVQAALVYIDANLGDLSSLDTINNDQWSGTDLALVNGGTGASTAAGARTALGLELGVATGNVVLAENIVLRTTGSEFATYGGTANAITLTTSRTLSALTLGMGFWFIPTVTNTTTVTCDIDGIGVVTLKTITGVNLPAGYLLADTPTFMFYNGTNLVCDRQIERGSNVNGAYTKYADGKLLAEHTVTGVTCTIAAGAIFSSGSGPTWTFPSVFIAAPATTVVTEFSTSWCNAGIATTTTKTDFRRFATTSDPTGRDCDLSAQGYWY